MGQLEPPAACKPPGCLAGRKWRSARRVHQLAARRVLIWPGVFVFSLEPQIGQRAVEAAWRPPERACASSAGLKRERLRAWRLASDKWSQPAMHEFALLGSPIWAAASGGGGGGGDATSATLGLPGGAFIVSISVAAPCETGPAQSGLHQC